VLRSKHASAGKVMAAATFAMAGASALQAVLYLRAFGINARTDGFFAALALYAIFGTFSQSLRVSSPPLLVGAQPRVSGPQFGFALGAIALPVLIATVPLAGHVSALLAPGLGHAARHVTERALPILGVAMILQLWAAGGATVLAVRSRFHSIAAAYGAGALAGLSSFLAVERTAGLLTLAWSMLAMAVVTLAVILLGLRRSDGAVQAARPTGALRPVRLLACALLILGRTGIYLAFNGLYLITLAFAGHYHQGDATILSYAYLFVSYIVAGTGFVLGMARVADMTRGARSEWPDILSGTVPTGFRYAMLLSAPAVAGLVAFGAPLVGSLLPSSLPASQVAALQQSALLLAPWLIAAQLTSLLLPVMFALGRAVIVNVCAPILVAAQLTVTALIGTVFGLSGVVGAMCVAPVAFVAFMLILEGGNELPRLVSELVRDGIRFVTLAVASFGGAYVVALAVPGGVARSLVCGLLGTVGYAVLLQATAGEQLQLLLKRLPTAP